MKRRTLLTACAGIAAGLAGCTGPGDTDSGAGTPTDSASPSPSSTLSPSPTPEQKVESTDFTVLDVECGTGEDAATVSREDGTVLVDGTVVGNDGCYTAALDAATLEAGELTVAVVPKDDRDPDEACMDCIVDVDYEATVEYRGSPDRVVVTHAGDVVAERDY
jgi:hypothetical protein